MNGHFISFAARVGIRVNGIRGSLGHAKPRHICLGHYFPGKFMSAHPKKTALKVVFVRVPGEFAGTHIITGYEKLMLQFASECGTSYNAPWTSTLLS